jgi:hypothetical protein
MSLRLASMTLLAGMALAAPAIAHADTKPVAVQVDSNRAPAPAPTHEAVNYAEREAKNKQVAEYEGGQSVVIVMSGAAFVAILLILLLL